MVEDIEFIGEVTVDTGTTFADTELGGLSSISYHAPRNVYYAISDDQGNRPDGNPPRFYTVGIELRDGSLEDGDVEFSHVTELLDRGRHPFVPGGLDPEGLVVRGGSLYISSEGNTLADPPIDPFIRRYNRQGRVASELPIPDYYIPNGIDHGVCIR